MSFTILSGVSTILTDPITTDAAESAQAVFTYLSERAAPYGGSAADMLERTPVSLWDSPSEIRDYWDGRDLSHIYPQSDYPEIADDWDNIIAEDRYTNRGRGATVMTEQEYDQAWIDNQQAAEIIDLDHADDSAEFAQALVELVG